MKEFSLKLKKQSSNLGDARDRGDSMVVEDKETSLGHKTIRQKDKGSIKMNSIKKIKDPGYLKKNQTSKKDMKMIYRMSSKPKHLSKVMKKVD
mmetsp:Transcript_30660/g.35086  ORF Transcript_30660/g.35086 Transcript_30660/m.35086 type:complete len:93 (+) Transcript_30660:384-662(+)